MKTHITSNMWQMQAQNVMGPRIHRLAPPKLLKSLGVYWHCWEQG